MILTDVKTTVTMEMMERAGMTQYGKIGVPDGRGSLKWRSFLELNDKDFDDIEEYFIKKNKVTQQK